MGPFGKAPFYLEHPLDRWRDFNEILFNVEKRGGGGRLKSLSDRFRDVVNSCGLVDVGYVGEKFTWFKSPKKKDTIRERLDRFFYSSNMPKDVTFKVNHLNLLSSDHRSILLCWRLESVSSRKRVRKRTIKFEESWTKFEECGIIINDEWGRTGMISPSNISGKV